MIGHGVKRGCSSVIDEGERLNGARVRRRLYIDALPGIVPKAEHQQDAADDDVDHGRVPGADHTQAGAMNHPAQQR